MAGQSAKLKCGMNSQNTICSMGVEVSGDLVTSILIVNNAGDSDAGSYSCTLPVFGNVDFPRARANVHLIYGKINEVNLDTICHL